MSVWVQVVQHLEPGGIETMALELLRLQSGNEKGLIVSLEGDKESAIRKWPKLEAYRANLVFLRKRPGWRLSTLFDLAKCFRRWQVSSVHTHHIGPLIYGGLAARMCGIDTIIHTEHDAWHLKQFRRRFLQKLSVQLIQPLLVADADIVAKELSLWLGIEQSRIQVIKNGIDVSRFQPGEQSQARACFGIPAEVRLIGCAGRLEKEKGQAALIEALRLLPPNVHLALAGGGSQQRELERIATSYSLTHRVHFLGVVEDMARFYQMLDVYCSPSFYEGLSLVILEAQACGIPAVVTDVGGSSEALCPGTGKLVKPGSAFAMAQSLDSLLKATGKGNPRHFVKQSGDLQITAQHYSAMRHRYLVSEEIS